MFGESSKSKSYKLFSAAALAVGLVAAPGAANASLIFDSTIDVTAQGLWKQSAPADAAGARQW
jgi:hypothetical protein